MSTQVQESPVTWDVEGWVKAALRAWARDYEEIQIVGHTVPNGQPWIEIVVDHVPIARVEVRKIPLRAR
jgi:hypothetical protein